MNTSRVTNIVVLIKGVIMILIGVIHTAAIFLGFPELLQHMAKDWAIEYSIYFGLTGMFWLFIGTIDLLSYSGLRRGIVFAWRIAFCSSIFPVVFGPIGLILLWGSGPAIIFPMTILFLSIIGTVVLVINHHKFIDSHA
jgi:hypothetical protein